MATEAPRNPATPPSSAPSGTIHTSSPGHSGAAVPSPRPAQHGAARQLLKGRPLSTLGSAPRSPQLSAERLQGHGGPLPGPLGSPSTPLTVPWWGRSPSKLLLSRVPERNGPSKAWPLLGHTHTLTHSWGPAESQPPDSGQAGWPSEASRPWGHTTHCREPGGLPLGCSPSPGSPRPGAGTGRQKAGPLDRGDGARRSPTRAILSASRAGPSGLGAGLGLWPGLSLP